MTADNPIFWQALTSYLNTIDFSSYLKKESKTMKCQYCDRTVTDDNTGALCPWHLDLEVLADYLQENEQPVTLPALCFLIGLGASRGGSFVIVPADLPGLITPEFAEKYEMGVTA